MGYTWGTEVTVSCPYCHRDAELVNGAVIYPHRRDLVAKRFWQCAPCSAWVGCHDGSTHPLGRLANAELRKAKQAAHAAFDPLWRSGTMQRKAAYAWLAEQIGVSVANCHIGMLDVDGCRAVVSACHQRSCAHCNAARAAVAKRPA